MYTGGEVSDCPHSTRKVNLKSLRDHHREVVRDILLGARNGEIAEKFGLSQSHVALIRRSQPVREKLEELQDLRDENAVDVSKELNFLLPKALKVYEDILINRETYDDKLVKATADTVMDKAPAGFPNRKVTQMEDRREGLSGANLLEIRDRALDAARRAGLLVDVTPAEADNHKVVDRMQSVAVSCEVCSVSE